MRTIKEYLTSPRLLVISLLMRFGFWIPDSVYLRMMYYFQTGMKLHLDHPRTFSEKIQWLKLHNHKPEYTRMVDKVLVKDYVAKIIGKEYIIPTLGVWKTFDEINFDSLPKQFVLKCNHDSGGVIICKDKRKLNRYQSRKLLNKSLKRNFFYGGREYPYKNVKPSIMAEEYMQNIDGGDLVDYKFFCFSGEVKMCQVISDRFDDEKIDFYDRNWNRLIGLIGLIGLNIEAKNSIEDKPRPKRYDEMIRIAESLSKGMIFVRVDLYDINDKIYFGELTFFPASGFGYFRPDEWNVKLGNMIKL